MKREQTRQDGDHWLVRPATIRRLWWIFGLVLAATVLAQLAIEVHGHFGADGWFGFYAAYGFLSCVAMVLFAKLLGVVLKRPVDYYQTPTSGDTEREHD
ncbi:MAG: hypothetical protein Kow0020_10540 [Wenzhouxiangellaceae bacterium]